jgi:hypothetical protein
MKTVIITIEGGIIQDMVLPPGIRVMVRDYDTEGADAEIDNLVVDDKGDEYIETVWEEGNNDN